MSHHRSRRRHVVTKGGLTLPRTGLLLHIPLPNSYLPIDWDEELGWESPMLGYQATPGDDTLFAAAPQLYDGDADTPLILSDTEVEALTNGYHIIFSTTKGLAVYGPYTTTDAVINKAHKYIKDLPLYDDTPTAYFNGVNITGSTSFDSGTLGTNPGQWVLDNTGVLVNAGVDVPAMEGMRLEGVPGDELSNASFVTDTLWIKGAGWTINTTLQQAIGEAVSAWTGIRRVGTVGKRYRVSVKVDAITGGLHVYGTGQIGSLITSTGVFVHDLTLISDGTIGVEASAAGFTGAIDYISIQELTPTWRDTTIAGEAILPSVNQATRTGSTDFSSFTPSTTFKKYTRTDPLVMPGYLSEPARTNYCLNSTAPVTRTTASLATGTYCLWVEGTGSYQASAGTAAATGGWGSSAVAGTPITFTITTAGTVVLTKTGTVTFVQLELGAFATSRIVTATAIVIRAGTALTYPTAGKIRSNNIAYLHTIVPRATGQAGVNLFGNYTDASNYTALLMDAAAITYRKRTAGTNTDATVSITHTKDVPLQILRVGTSEFGMRVAVRSYSGGAWSAWTNGTLNSTAGAKSNAIVAASYQLGSLNSLTQPTANISELDTLFIPTGITDPLAWAKAQWGLPA